MNTTGFLNVKLTLGSSYIYSRDILIEGVKLTEEGLEKITEDGNVKLTESGMSQEKTSEYPSNANPPDTGLLDVALPGSDNVSLSIANLKAITKQFNPARLLDDTDDTYVYYGSDTGIPWQIIRTTRIDLSEVKATETNNSSYDNLDTAWTNRVGLTYS